MNGQKATALEEHECFTMPLQKRHKSWMDGAVFEKWVREMDKKFVSVGRKVALVINNCPAHRQIKNLKLKKLFFLLVAAWDGVTTKFVLNCF